MDEIIQPNKSTRLEKTACESAVFAASNLPVTWTAIVLQNLKVEKQLTNHSYPQAYKSLKAQGPRRFFQGYLPYTGKNMMSSAVSGPALMISSEYMKQQGFSPVNGAVLAALSATGIEIAATAYAEGKELNATKGLSVAKDSWQAAVATTKHTARIIPYMYARNLGFWAASVGTHEMVKEAPPTTQNIAGAVAGMVAGVVSMPFDTILTSMYGSKKTLPAIIKEHGAKGLFNGAGIHAVQLGAYTAATVAAISFLERLGASRAEHAGRAKSRD